MKLSNGPGKPRSHNPLIVMYWIVFTFIIAMIGFMLMVMGHFFSGTISLSMAVLLGVLYPMLRCIEWI